MEPIYDEKAQAYVTITPEAAARKRPVDHLDEKEMKVRKAHVEELKQLTGVFSSLATKFEAKREGAISCSNIKAAMPLCREAEGIRVQVEKARTAINESRTRYQLALEEVRDDRIDRIRLLCTSRGAAKMHPGLKLLNDVCMDFRETDKADKAARDAAYDLVWTTLSAVADAIAPE